MHFVTEQSRRDLSCMQEKGILLELQLGPVSLNPFFPSVVSQSCWAPFHMSKTEKSAAYVFLQTSVL